jgi:hypothetical protein
MIRICEPAGALLAVDFKVELLPTVVKTGKVTLGRNHSHSDVFDRGGQDDV